MKIEELEAVKNKVENEILKIPGVTGIGIGVGRNEQPCLKIYVEKLNPMIENSIQKILEELGVEPLSVETEIEETGPIKPIQ